MRASVRKPMRGEKWLILFEIINATKAERASPVKRSRHQQILAMFVHFVRLHTHT